MGRFVNPDNVGFARILNGTYVDKTGLVTLFDSTLNGSRSLVMVSRPRRFGKTFAAQAIAEFYSCGSDSRGLFEGLEVSRHGGWDANLNQYNVLLLDMGAAMCVDRDANMGEKVTAMVLPELRHLLSDAGSSAQSEGDLLVTALHDVVVATGRKFVIVIDDWDAPYHLAQDNLALQEDYIDWLRALFMNEEFTSEAVAGAYMTGILPVRKRGGKSSIPSFHEHTMVDPGQYAPYMGFTDDEVSALCARYSLELDDVGRWYDGYGLPAFATATEGPSHVLVYAPHSVMRACEYGAAGPCWSRTIAIEGLRRYTDMDFEGLRADLLRAIDGEWLPINPSTFQNDMASVASRDDALALLVHLGYLSYDGSTGLARVPNEEVCGELRRALEGNGYPR